MGELRSVVYIGFEETVLFFWSWVATSAADPRSVGFVIVVAPFGEVVCKLESWKISCRVFKVDDDELLVFIGCLEKW